MIADPMANIGGDPAAGAGPHQEGGADAAGGGSTKEVFDPLVMQVNLQRIDRIHAVMGIVSGCVAGIIGLTGLQGLRKFRTYREATLCPHFHFSACFSGGIPRIKFTQRSNPFF